MTDKNFSIVFSGKLVEGCKPPEVLNKLCVVLGLDGAQVRELFKSGSGAIIRKDLDGATAYALLEKLRDAGAVCTVKEIITPPTREPAFSGMQTVSQPRSGQPQRPQGLKPNWQPPAVSQKQGAGMFSLVFRIILLAAI